MLTLAAVAASGHGKVAQCKGAVMDYQVVLPPVQYQPRCLSQPGMTTSIVETRALAERVDQPAGFPIDPGTVLIFLGGVATTIATGVVTDLISKLLERKFFNKEKPACEIVVIQQAPGSCWWSKDKKR